MGHQYLIVWEVNPEGSTEMAYAKQGVAAKKVAVIWHSEHHQFLEVPSR